MTSVYKRVERNRVARAKRERFRADTTSTRREDEARDAVCAQCFEQCEQCECACFVCVNGLTSPTFGRKCSPPLAARKKLAADLNAIAALRDEPRGW